MNPFWVRNNIYIYIYLQIIIIVFLISELFFFEGTKIAALSTLPKPVVKEAVKIIQSRSENNKTVKFMFHSFF